MRESEKYDEAIVCLERIAKLDGSPEHPALVRVGDIGVEISDEDGDFVGGGSALCTKVTEPYSKERHGEWREKAGAGYIWSESDYEVLEGDGRRLRYTACKGSSIVGSAISGDMSSECGIEGDDLTEEEWSRLTEEDEYKSAEKQVLRELLAVDLASERGLEW
jgi:hypothetical protein